MNRHVHIPMHLPVKSSALFFFKQHLAFFHGKDGKVDAHAAVYPREKLRPLLSNNNGTGLGQCAFIDFYASSF